MSIRSFEGVQPEIAEDAYIDEAAVVIGNVHIQSGSSLWPMVVVRGDVNHIYIGENTNLQDGTIVHANHDGPYTPGGDATTIGNGVVVGHQAMIHACTIQDNVLIGMSAIVLDGAIIKPEVMVAAGSLVPPGKVLESGYLYKGSPVKQIRLLEKKEIARIYYSATYYRSLAKRHGAVT